jgi:hypothetical protein
MSAEQVPDAVAMARIRVALGRMPYGGSLRAAFRPVETLADVAELLDELAALLRGVAERDQARDAELMRYAAWAAAVRDLLGPDGTIPPALAELDDEAVTR